MNLLKKVLASYTFRFTLLYVTSLSIGVLLVLTLLYAALSYDYFVSLGDSVKTELQELEQAYEQGGSAGVNRFVKQRNHPFETNRFFYLLVDENLNKLAGNLDDWPRYQQYGESWLGFQLDIIGWDGEQVRTEFFARAADLDDGNHLLVARHYGDVVDNASLVWGVLIRSMVVTIILGSLGGFVVGAKSVEQLDKFNRTLHHIMSGDLSERVSDKGQLGEIKELANNVDRMLDRIQMLMEGMRQVSDNIAHDLRTPLTRLRNHLSDLHEKLAGEDEQETVQELIGEADAILATFAALLRIARVESGNRRSAFEPIDPRIIVLDVIELYEPLAMDKAIEISQSLDEGVTLDGDRDLLFQAVANLIDNAIKYTPDHGSIAIGLERRAQQLILTVSDSGCGIPEADRSKVFHRFYRVESSRSEFPGNGLGLSLVWAVVRLHNGEIFLTDNHPGLRVTIRLPLTNQRV